jgi:hypothetical protein
MVLGLVFPPFAITLAPNLRYSELLLPINTRIFTNMTTLRSLLLLLYTSFLAQLAFADVSGHLNAVRGAQNPNAAAFSVSRGNATVYTCINAELAEEQTNTSIFKISILSLADNGTCMSTLPWSEPLTNGSAQAVEPISIPTSTATHCKQCHMSTMMASSSPSSTSNLRNSSSILSFAYPTAPETTYNSKALGTKDIVWSMLGFTVFGTMAWLTVTP